MLYNVILYYTIIYVVYKVLYNDDHSLRTVPWTVKQWIIQEKTQHWIFGGVTVNLYTVHLKSLNMMVWTSSQPLEPPETPGYGWSGSRFECAQRLGISRFSGDRAWVLSSRARSQLCRATLELVLPALRMHQPALRTKTISYDLVRQLLDVTMADDGIMIQWSQLTGVWPILGYVEPCRAACAMLSQVCALNR